VRKLKQQGIKFSFQKCADEEDQQVKVRHSKLAAAHKGACATFLGLLISYEAGVVVAIIYSSLASITLIILFVKIL
jgi:hypothetical protein